MNRNKLQILSDDQQSDRPHGYHGNHRGNGVDAVLTSAYSGFANVFAPSSSAAATHSMTSGLGSTLYDGIGEQNGVRLSKVDF